jgi:hypothetical protein
MKKKKLLLVLVFGILFSCENNESAVNKDPLTELKSKSGFSYNESLAKWNELKSINGNSYKYQTTFVSWIGRGFITELEIKEGKVISRICQEFKINETGQREITDIYTETASDIGSHEKGALPLTIDDFYESCASKYLVVDGKKNTLYFDTELDGSMILCGFVPNECQDDCYQGVKINSFKWVK